MTYTHQKHVNFVIPYDYYEAIREEAYHAHITVSEMLRQIIKERYGKD